jgi:hypothetical protein
MSGRVGGWVRGCACVCACGWVRGLGWGGWVGWGGVGGVGLKRWVSGTGVWVGCRAFVVCVRVVVVCSLYIYIHIYFYIATRQKFISNDVINYLDSTGRVTAAQRNPRQRPNATRDCGSALQFCFLV